MSTPRIYLTGRLAIEHRGALVEERHLPGRQGRLAFAYLVANRHTATDRADLAEVIWGDASPAEAEAALSAILSKLRGALRKAGLADGAAIDGRTGAVRLRLPADARVDIEEAARAIDEAEGAMRAGDSARAWGPANVSVSVARRPFLPGEEAGWIEAQRRTLRGILVRGLQCLSMLSAAIGDWSLAVLYASEIVDLEPFRETGYQQLMRAHAAAGNRAEALRVFSRCRELLRDELGAGPSRQTEAVYADILRSGE